MSRNSLHKSKLYEFTKWLIGKGWETQATKGEYEVLRMSKRGKYGVKSLVVHTTNKAKEHFTTSGASESAFIQWMTEKKAAGEVGDI